MDGLDETLVALRSDRFRAPHAFTDPLADELERAPVLRQFLLSSASGSLMVEGMTSPGSPESLHRGIDVRLGVRLKDKARSPSLGGAIRARGLQPLGTPVAVRCA